MDYVFQTVIFLIVGRAAARVCAVVPRLHRNQFLRVGQQHPLKQQQQQHPLKQQQQHPLKQQQQQQQQQHITALC